MPGLRGRDMMSLNHGKGRSLPYGKGKGFDKGKGYGKGAKNTSPAMPPLPAGFESVPGIPAKGAEANAVQGMQALPVRSSAAPRMPAASAAKNGIAGTQPPPPMNKAPAMPAQPADGVQPVPDPKHARSHAHLKSPQQKCKHKKHRERWPNGVRVGKSAVAII